MSNYLTEIENKFSRIHGKSKLLSPLDWALAQSWENAGIPLRIVLRAMDDVQKNFAAKKRPNKINSLSYFTQAVEREFADFSKSQIGKSTEKTENDMNDFLILDDSAVFIENNLLPFFDCNYFRENTLSDLMCAAISKVRSELIILIDDINSKQLNTGEIETRLSEIASEFDLSLVADFTDAARQKIINEAQAEYPKYKITDQVMQKILIRKCYRKFGLPELTLFAL